MGLREDAVTTSYTCAFWSWDDWELQLDWMALHGINIALAWIGVEKVFLDVFRDIGLTDGEMESFFSGPAFLAWNHFGNIQGSWGGNLPEAWIEDQFAMQKKIVARMVELGITPILPAFPGFVPESIKRVWPNVSTATSPQWSGFPPRYTEDTYITPYDPRFAQLQKAFIIRQQEAYGNVTSFWTLDQFNENQPASGDLGYLHNVSYNTWTTLKHADPSAVWVMQGWLFASDSSFWTNDRIQAFLDGVPVDSDMLILDLFAESAPQWQRTDSFYGKPWIWCMLHDYGGNMGLYGQIENVTKNSVEAVQASKSIAGFGLTMEGQEGNEVMYDLMLDQAWSRDPLDTDSYFRDWVTARYGGSHHAIPDDLYRSWDMVRSTVYNNTNPSVTAVIKSILVLMPDISGLVNRTGHHGTYITYNTSVLEQAWRQMYQAGKDHPWLFELAAYQYDLVDWTRQVLANCFQVAYEKLIRTYQDGGSVHGAGQKLQMILKALDYVLATNPSFHLDKWIDEGRRSSSSAGDADFFEYNARNQITLWGPTGQIEDYASKQWSGLVGDYYATRWCIFTEYLSQTKPTDYNGTALKDRLHEYEFRWVKTTTGSLQTENPPQVVLQTAMENMMKNQSDIFNV